MIWKAEDHVGDLSRVMAYFHSRLPGWWFTVGACSICSSASVSPDPKGMDAILLETGDGDVTKFFDTRFDVDLLAPATMADALLRATYFAMTARDAYFARNRLSDAIAALADLDIFIAGAARANAGEPNAIQ